MEIYGDKTILAKVLWKHFNTITNRINKWKIKVQKVNMWNYNGKPKLTLYWNSEWVFVYIVPDDLWNFKKNDPRKKPKMERHNKRLWKVWDNAHTWGVQE